MNCPYAPNHICNLWGEETLLSAFICVICG